MSAKPKLTKRDLRCLHVALGDAIRDREALVDAYTFPSYVKPDASARQVRREAQNQARRYRNLSQKLAQMLAPAAGGKA